VASTRYWGKGHYWVAISDLSDEIISETKEQITEEGVSHSNVKLLKKGTLMMSFKLSIGKMAFAGCDLYTNEAIAGLPLKGEAILPAFLPILLRATTLTGKAEEAAKGLTLNKEKLKQIPIRYPEDHLIQTEIANLVNGVSTRAKQIQQVHDAFSEDFRKLLMGLYQRISAGAQWKTMKEVCPIVRRPIEIKNGVDYHELGIRSFGKGTFHKPILRGQDVGTKRLYEIHAGDLVLHNVFAWEGAIAVVREEDHGRCGSHRFISCLPKPKIMTAPYLYFHFSTKKGLHDIEDASPGGAGRNKTLGLTKLEKIKVPVPDYDDQLLFCRLWELIQQAQLLQKDIKTLLAQLPPSIIFKLFSEKE